VFFSFTEFISSERIYKKFFEYITYAKVQIFQEGDDNFMEEWKMALEKFLTFSAGVQTPAERS